ncbi:hypothetical protein BLL52_3234 [Rhodoferax antarcticus ANT.BR]|uniref:Uncharacterized protein n=1 Tax=Rhodoferax antarcticus ANT.BR TaxID=1111071 RepID=A0A1Q8YBZ0_9BURK|nr:hypothetical protein BLL52_3234 [Rhodoferax antarcticus ANT.BR]
MPKAQGACENLPVYKPFKPLALIEHAQEAINNIAILSNENAW